MTIGDFFRRGKAAQTDGDSGGSYEPAPGTSIRFDPNLIGFLKHDHRKLLGLYQGAYTRRWRRTIMPG
jgi:hypothetical protein